MKRIGKALILAGVLLFLGIMISMIGIGYLIGDNRSSRSSGATAQDSDGNIQCETKTYVIDAADLQQVKVDLTVEDIRIEPTDGDQITIEYKDIVDHPRYEVKSADGTLRIGHTNTGISGQMILVPPVLTKDNFQFGGNGQELEHGDIKIRIPENYMGNYDLSVTSGSVSMEDIHVSGNIKCGLTSGEARVSNVTGEKGMQVSMTSGDFRADTLSLEDNLDINSTSGDSNLTAVTLGGNLHTDVTSGDFYADTLSLKGNLDINSTSGDSDLTDATLGGDLYTDVTSGRFSADQLTVSGLMNMNTTSGNINIKKLTLGNAIKVDGTSGSVTVSLTDAMEQYTIAVDTVSGSCNLPNSYTGGTKKISVDTVSGNIDFRFEE